ncbi:MAG: metallophosphoesterase family protein [Pseudoxanthomonas sp.]
MAVLLSLALASFGPAAMAMEAVRAAEPNTLVPAGVSRYASNGFPDRIVASPAADASTGFAVAWRTDARAKSPWLEIVVADDSPDMGTPRSVRARSQALTGDNGTAHHHRARVQGLQADTLYAYRVQGVNTWSPWMQLRTAGNANKPLTLLYFGDTQNKNASLTTRVIREAQRHAPDARLALFAGDLVSGGDGEDDNEWGEWFDAGGSLLSSTMVAPAIGNHEYFEELKSSSGERRVLGAHWPLQFMLPDNGARAAPGTSYWFDFQGVRVAVLDGTSALDLGTAAAQARWLDQALASNPNRWSIILAHQPFFSPRADRDNAVLRKHLLPVIERHRADLVLQGHDHVYARRNAGKTAPVYVVSVAGAKQYRLSASARKAMRPVAEDTQLFQVIRLEGDRLRYEARTATGQLYDAFALVDEAGGKRLLEQEEGRIDERLCSRVRTLKGREDRCWE